MTLYKEYEILKRKYNRSLKEHMLLEDDNLFLRERNHNLEDLNKRIFESNKRLQNIILGGNR